MDSKYENLLSELRSYGSVCVALSGGADSCLLIYAAREALGDKACAVTVRADMVAPGEIAEAERLCESLGAAHYVIDFSPYGIKEFRENAPDRCYHCKTGIFTAIRAKAKSLGFTAAADGTNFDDLSADRPGLRAIAELGIKSPLAACGVTKSEVRKWSEEFGLPTFDAPSNSCFATRIPTGEEITPEKIHTVYIIEKYLREKLKIRSCRARLAGDTARLEVPREEFTKILSDENLVKFIKERGFAHVCLDLEGR